jgi:hypothetical protein
LSDRQAVATLGNADNDAGGMLAEGDGADVSDRSESGTPEMSESTEESSRQPRRVNPVAGYVVQCAQTS